MEINHDILLSLKFTQLTNRPDRYVYKEFKGKLNAEAGTFQFDGFGPSIGSVYDLLYIKVLIDYNE